MASILPSISININYEQMKTWISEFISDYKDESTGNSKYLEVLQQVANRELDTVYIDLDDIRTFMAEPDLLDAIRNNSAHYIDLFSDIVDRLMPEPTVDVSYRDEVLDVILLQRQQRNARILQSDTENASAQDLFPSQLTRRYTLYFRPLTKYKSLAVREIKGEHLGHLITLRGIVTRISDVKPSVLVNAYTCDKCGSEIFQEVRSRTFAPLLECQSRECKENNSKGMLFMSTRASKFQPFQEARVQELSDQVPIGHIPRTLSVHLTGPLVRSLTPGDVADISGIFLPAPYTGFRALRAGLLTDTYLEAQHVSQHKQSYDALMDPEAQANIDAIRAQGRVYERLAHSIAPEIYGHLDVKKALLLLLVGGVSKAMGDGLRIRGDINVCLMGDPGVAKSQLLKYITKVAPRGVYTTGRGSSGVGLTAAVMRDPVTDEMVLEGGALVLADNGVCCIDEFDKMDDNDRTAIHEVMEQQTISISKAGISTTLNARASILAAANPLYGRYNPRLSPVDNINLPAALLSRFDIMFVIRDVAERGKDEQLARHVTYVHAHGQPISEDSNDIPPAILRQYISAARQYRPIVPPEVADYVSAAYVQLRQAHRADMDSKKQFSHVTPRTLLGVLRMSQALARLDFASTVNLDHVDEALRLLEVCRDSLSDDGEERMEDDTVMTKIVNTIKGVAMSSGGDEPALRIPMATIRDRVLARGFTQDDLDRCIEEYEMYNVWQVAGDDLVFV